MCQLTIDPGIQVRSVEQENYIDSVKQITTNLLIVINSDSSESII